MIDVKSTSKEELLATRAFSKALFGGAQYRIEIGAAISQKKTINTTELSDELGIARQSVNQELHLLERIGLLQRSLAPTDSARKIYLLKVKSDYWNFCVEATAEAVGRLRGVQPF